MPKYPMPKYPRPEYPLPEYSEPAVAAVLPLPPPARAHVLQRALKEVYVMFKRLRSSYLRSNAVRDARLDAALTGNQGHLLLHYFNSVK